MSSILQAVECYLSNVIPSNGAENFTLESCVALRGVVAGKVKKSCATFELLT